MDATKEQTNEVEQMMADVLTDAPIQFSIGEDGQKFNLYPKTLGVKMLIDRLKPQLGINDENIKTNALLECLRICQTQQDFVLRMIAYSTFRKKTQIQDAELIEKRMAFFKENLELSDMATLLLHILKDDGIIIEQLKEHLQMDKEMERKRNILKAKQEAETERSSVSYGGVSIYGTLLSFFAEKYGWSIDYIIWGVSYTNLMLMYFDHPESIYLSKEEIDKLPVDMRNEMGAAIDANDPENVQRIIEMFKEDFND